MLERWGMGKYIDKYIHIHIYVLYYTSITSSVIEPSSPPNNKKKGEHILWFLLWFWLSFECSHFPKQITNYNAVRFPQSWGKYLEWLHGSKHGVCTNCPETWLFHEHTQNWTPEARVVGRLSTARAAAKNRIAAQGGPIKPSYSR